MIVSVLQAFSHAVDPGLALVCAKAQTSDAGQRLEDAVYLELRRRMTPMRRDALSFRSLKAARTSRSSGVNRDSTGGRADPTDGRLSAGRFSPTMDAAPSAQGKDRS